MTVLRRLAGFITHNFWWKVLALAIAFVLWVVVASEPELSTFETVKLGYRNVPDDLEITTNPAENVSLELRGPASELSRISDGRRPAVIIDMTAITPGQHTFPISERNVSLTGGVRLVRAIPSEVRFEFDRRLVRPIPVQVTWAGEGADGYVVASYTVSPNNVVIAGPASHVATLKNAVTDPINVSNVVGTAEYRVNAFVPDPFVRLQSSPQVVVTVTMRKKRLG